MESRDDTMGPSSSLSSHFLSDKKIIIAGAGIGGLALGIALRRQWEQYTTAKPPAVVIYEREAQQTVAGREGYTLSIRSDTPGGVQALQKLGVLDEVVAASLSAADGTQQTGFCMWDRSGATLVKMRARAPPGLSVGGLRVRRSDLRIALVRAAEAADCTIHWGSGCAGVGRRRSDGRLEVRLMGEGGEQTDDCDLLVAADGASSKIRSQLRPADKLLFAGATMIHGLARFGSDRRPPSPVDRDWGMAISGEGPGLFASPYDAHSALWSLSVRSDARREHRPAPAAEALEAEVRGYVDIFPPWFAELLDASDPAEMRLMNAQDKQPFAHADVEFPEVVFIGDANHAVSPFAGNGANMALSDGWDLAASLCGSPSLAVAVRQYDSLVVPRSTKVWKDSRRNISVGHATGLTLWFYMLIVRLLAFFSGQVETG